MKCAVPHGIPSEAETALNGYHFDDTVRLFREQARGSGAEDSAHNGLIPALLHALSFANLKQPVFGITIMDTSRSGEEARVEIAFFMARLRYVSSLCRIDYRDDLTRFSRDPKLIQHCSSTSMSGVSIADCY